MSTWWIVINEKTSPFSYDVVESNSVPSPLASDGGPFYTQAAAVSEAATLNSNAKKGVTGALASGTAAAANDVANAVPGLADIGAFFHALSEANTWIRVVEVILGVGLAIVALDKLFAGTSVGNVTHKVAKAAFLA